MDVVSRRLDCIDVLVGVVASHFAGAFLKTTLIYLHHLCCILLSSICIYLIVF